MKKDSTAKTIEFLHAYGKCENDTMENAKPSPVEKGDRGAVDKAYPGIQDK